MRLTTFSLLAVLAQSAGCTQHGHSVSKDPEVPVEFTPLEYGVKLQYAPPAETPTPEYRIQAGDELDVKFYYDPALNERAMVRSDGRITLQLVDDVEAAGLTPAELDERLTAAYERLLKRVEVSVIVRRSAAQTVYVGGEVVTPSLIPLRPQMTALEAVVMAGGLRETAEPASVILISRGEQNSRLVRQVNLKRAWEENVGLEELGLRPFDVVYVPKSPVAEANKFVDQYIRQMIPLNLHAGFTYILTQRLDNPEIASN